MRLCEGRENVAFPPVLVSSCCSRKFHSASSTRTRVSCSRGLVSAFNTSRNFVRCRVRVVAGRGGWPEWRLGSHLGRLPSPVAGQGPETEPLDGPPFLFSQRSKLLLVTGARATGIAIALFVRSPLD